MLDIIKFVLSQNETRNARQQLKRENLPTHLSERRLKRATLNWRTAFFTAAKIFKLEKFESFFRVFLHIFLLIKIFQCKRKFAWWAGEKSDEIVLQKNTERKLKADNGFAQKHLFSIFNIYILCEGIISKLTIYV